MTPSDIRSLRKKHRLTREQFGEAIGMSDPIRIVCAWEKGQKSAGKPFTATGSAVAAMRMLDAVIDTLEMDIPSEARARLLGALPDCIRSIA